MELTLKERQKLTRVTAKKYRAARKREKTKILDTFVDQTGYGRKYAIHVLANEGTIKPVKKRLRLKAAHGGGRKREYPRVYDDAVRDALIPVWEAFNCQCGKLLAPFLHDNIDRITAEPGFAVTAEVLVKLRRISAATIDRLLRKTKAQSRIRGTSGTKPATQHLKARIPILTHFECVQAGPGLWQIDLVQHDGGNPSGEFCYTLTITEVKNCWTMHFILKNKAFTWVYQALNAALSVLPLPVAILHSDNGSEFINHPLLIWCEQHHIALTRSRSDRKNDNCFVEQKNGHSVRKIIGYARFSGDKGVAALQSVFDHYDRLLNFFYPCQKLLSKERHGAKVKKTYDQPRSPYDRARSSPDTDLKIKRRLVFQKNKTDLMREMKLMQQAIDKLPALADPVPAFVPKGGLKPLLFGSNSSIP